MYRTSTILCAIVGGIAAVAMSLAQDAHADEASFIRAIDGDGMPITSVTLVLGHQICVDILANGVDGVDTQVNMALEAGLSQHDTAYFIGDAVTELCPAGTPAVKAWAASYGA